MMSHLTYHYFLNVAFIIVLRANNWSVTILVNTDLHVIQSQTD